MSCVVARFFSTCTPCTIDTVSLARIQYHRTQPKRSLHDILILPFLIKIQACEPCMYVYARAYSHIVAEYLMLMYEYVCTVFREMYVDGFMCCCTWYSIYYTLLDDFLPNSMAWHGIAFSVWHHKRARYIWAMCLRVLCFDTCIETMCVRKGKT